jgi:hypothetical protein
MVMSFVALLLAICFLAIVLLLNYLYKQTNFYKEQFADAGKFELLKKKQFQKLEIVNLGSNQPKFAFDYSESALRGMNWAVGPQSLEYDFKILKQYHSHLKDNAFVIIPICPFQFFAMFGHKNNVENYKYYHILEANMINNYSPWIKLTHIKFPVLSAGKKIAKIMFKNRDHAGNHSKLILETNPMNDDELKQDAGWMINLWLTSFSLDSIDNIVLSSENKENIETNMVILHDMIEFCLEHNYRPVIMLLPITNGLYDLLPESFRNKYITEPIQKASNQNVPVLDYLHDQRFVSHDLFISSWWFNSSGRKIFTRAMMDDCIRLYAGNQ